MKGLSCWGWGREKELLSEHRGRWGEGVLPVEVTCVSGWGAHAQTDNILGLDEAEGFRAAF